MDKNNREWKNLSLKEKAELMSIYVKNGYNNVADIRKDYDANYAHYMEANPDFMQRLRDNDTTSVANSDGSRSTHKLSYIEGNNGSVLFPAVQREKDGTLKDHTGEPLNGYWSAEEKGDTINVSTPSAIWLSENYKKDFPKYFEKFINKFEEGGPTDIEGVPTDSEGVDDLKMDQPLQKLTPISGYLNEMAARRTQNENPDSIASTMIKYIPQEDTPQLYIRKWADARERRAKDRIIPNWIYSWVPMTNPQARGLNRWNKEDVDDYLNHERWDAESLRNHVDESMATPISSFDYLDKESLPYGATGLYDQQRRRIFLNDTSDTDVAIHELTHASKFVDGVPNDSPFGGYPMIPDHDYNLYLDKSKEIIARLMQVRYRNNLDPYRTYTEEDIGKMMEDPNFKDEDIVNRYPIWFTTQLFNQTFAEGGSLLAQNTPEEQPTAPYEWTDKDTRDYIQAFESFSDKAYDDGKGNITAGWGHKLSDTELKKYWNSETGEPIGKIPKEITDRWWAEDFSDAAYTVDEVYADEDLPSWMIAALTSMAFNGGKGFIAGYKGDDGVVRGFPKMEAAIRAYSKNKTKENLAAIIAQMQYKDDNLPNLGGLSNRYGLTRAVMEGIIDPTKVKEYINSKKYSLYGSDKKTKKK